MSKKDFIRGVETATKANEAFMHKQAAATEELGKRIIQKIDEQGKIIDVILDTLNAQEKKELYDLQSAYDIADLGENEKEVLASFLLTLISKYNQDSETQKDYYFAVKKHLGVTDVSPDFDLSLVENVDSRAELKAMLQTVCEFLFLKTGDTSFLDEFEDEIGYFGLSPKVIREIVEPIERIYDVLGLRGIVEHYIPADSEEETDPEHYGLVTPVSKELIIRDGNRDIDRGTEMKYENLRVIITKQLHVNGRAVFSNCEIVFAWDGNIALLVIEEDSSLEFHNCEFIVEKQSKSSLISIDQGSCLLRNCMVDGQQYRFGMCNDVYQDKNGNPLRNNRSFINIDGFDKPAKLSLEHCKIANCSGTFVNADGNIGGNNHKVIISDCMVDGHAGNFLFGRYAYTGDDTGIVIDNTTFQNIEGYSDETGISKWDFKEKYPFENALIALTHERYLCKNSTFIDLKESYISHGMYEFEGAVSAKTQSCKFVRVMQENKLGGIIDDCEFIDMTALVWGECNEGYNPEVVISNSRFKNYNGNMIVCHGRLEHCKFFDSNLHIVLEGKKSRTDNYTSEAIDLYFENCTSANNEQNPRYDVIWGAPCILQAKSYLDRSEICVYFNGCKFKNCNSRGDFIRTGYSGIGSFGRSKDVVVGRVQNTTVE